MRWSIRRLPFYETTTHVDVIGEMIPIWPYQMIVWVSIRAHGRLSPQLPALVDTGLSMTFSIREDQLRRWAGTDPASLQTIGYTVLSGQRLPLRQASIALHSNARGERDVLRGDPHELVLREGIVVYPSENDQAPRLPLLGLRALVRNRLRMVIDGRRMCLSIGRGLFG